MPIYSYKAINQAGKVITGSMEAANEKELSFKLSQSFLELVSAKESRDWQNLLGTSKISLQDLIMIFIHFHQLDKVGMSIIDSIADLRDTSDSKATKELMRSLYESIRNGKMLSEAMSEHPKVFDVVCIGLIKAGEKTGNLTEIFAHLEAHYKWMLAIRSKVKKAISYPIFLFFLLSGVVSVMMIAVIPKVTSFLVSQKMDLPGYTVALIATSDFFVNSWYLLLGIPITISIILRIIYLRSSRFAFLFDKYLLQTPVIGNLVSKLDFSKFCHFFAITYRSGIGVLECLETSTNVVSNLAIRDAIRKVRIAVSEGKNLTDALEETALFPPLVLRMFKIGENSGALDSSLKNVNEFYDREINNTIDSLIGMMQPALTLIMGGLLMWITISVFGPIYGSFSKVN
jgi:type IV pilus assembly protein PilC